MTKKMTTQEQIERLIGTIFTFAFGLVMGYLIITN